MVTGAKRLIIRAIELDQSNNYFESISCYAEGVQTLLHGMENLQRQSLTYEQAVSIFNKVRDYRHRTEQLMWKLEKLERSKNYQKHFRIAEDSTGYAYETIFGEFLDHHVKYVIIEDAQIYKYYQCQNLVRFLELVVKKCPKVCLVELVTKEKPIQETWLDQIKVSLLSCNIKIVIKYSHTLHDRKITLSNGWVIKIGRGLDYFKAPDHKLGLGTFDMNLRKCCETSVDIYSTNTI